MLIWATLGINSKNGFAGKNNGPTLTHRFFFNPLTVHVSFFNHHLFHSRPDWEGVCGVAPDSRQLEEAVSTKDLYMWV